eukprot:2786424-Ditylum_brightwellii.AAC.1
MPWTHALKATKAHCNCFDINKEGISLKENFANVRNVRNLSDAHTLGCPVYILDHQLQDSSGSITKRDPQFRLGINLGPSLAHAGTVPPLWASLVESNSIPPRNLLS